MADRNISANPAIASAAITLTPSMQNKANHHYWQLFSLLSAMMSLTKDEDDDLIEVKTLLSMAMETAGNLYGIITPATQEEATA